MVTSFMKSGHAGQRWGWHLGGGYFVEYNFCYVFKKNSIQKKLLNVIYFIL